MHGRSSDILESGRYQLAVGKILKEFCVFDEDFFFQKETNPRRLLNFFEGLLFLYFVVSTDCIVPPVPKRNTGA